MKTGAAQTGGYVSRDYQLFNHQQDEERRK